MKSRFQNGTCGKTGGKEIPSLPPVILQTIQFFTLWSSVEASFENEAQMQRQGDFMVTEEKPTEGPAPLFDTPVRSLSRCSQQHQHHAVDNAGGGAEDNDRACHQKHLGGHAGDEALWLCQDRHTVFSEFFQLPPKWGALIVLACRYKFKPARSTHIYLNLS